LSSSVAGLKHVSVSVGGAAVPAGGNTVAEFVGEKTTNKIDVTLLLSTARQGNLQVAYGHGFRPGEQVSGLLEPGSVYLGTQIADAQGDVVFNIQLPDNLSLGTHTVTLTGTGSGSASRQFQVVANDKAGKPKDNGLAYTGIDVSGLLGLGLVLIAMALWAVAGRRMLRRENDSH
jgi:hypothetical protein